MYYIHYTVEEGIFVVIVYKFLEQQMYQNIILKTALKSMTNKGLGRLQKVKVKYVTFKNRQRKKSYYL